MTEDTYDRIEKLKQEVADSRIEAHADIFEDEVKDEVLMIGSVSLEEVQAEERRLREEHILFQQQEAKIAREKAEHLQLRQEQAKLELSKASKKRRKEVSLLGVAFSRAACSGVVSYAINSSSLFRFKRPS